MTTLALLKTLRDNHAAPQSREGQGSGPPSNSELRRWCDRKAVIINGMAHAWNDTVEFPIRSLVLFPKRRTVTLC